jgi:hypothetical protein
MEELRASIPKKMPRKKPFDRGQIALLVAAGLVILVVYGVLMGSLAQPKQAPTLRALQPAGEGVTELQVAREQAQARALGWQADARLVGAGTQWQLAGDDRLTLGRPSWSFSYYSPGTGEVQTLTVDQAGTQLVRRVPVRRAPEPVEADWSLGSDDLLIIFMAYGGEDFVRQHAHANLHFRLSGQEGERPTWYLSAIDPVARQSFMVRVDALSREVVPKRLES